MSVNQKQRVKHYITSRASDMAGDRKYSDKLCGGYKDNSVFVKTPPKTKVERQRAVLSDECFSLLWAPQFAVLAGMLLDISDDDLNTIHYEISEALEGIGPSYHVTEFVIRHDSESQVLEIDVALCHYDGSFAPTKDKRIICPFVISLTTLPYANRFDGEAIISQTDEWRIRVNKLVYAVMHCFNSTQRTQRLYTKYPHLTWNYYEGGMQRNVPPTTVNLSLGDVEYELADIFRSRDGGFPTSLTINRYWIGVRDYDVTHVWMIAN